MNKSLAIAAALLAGVATTALYAQNTRQEGGRTLRCAAWTAQGVCISWEGGGPGAQPPAARPSAEKTPKDGETASPAKPSSPAAAGARPQTPSAAPAAVEPAKDEANATSESKGEDVPASKDELFGTSKPSKPQGEAPVSRDELFGNAQPSAADQPGLKPARDWKLRGFLQNETAYTYASPGHWSRGVFRAQLGASGTWSENLKWKATVRGEVDPIYAFGNFYPDAVQRDQRADALIGETYIDTSLKGWDLRLGRQHIIWGEMVGLFFADVVSAKDLRSFVLPSFDIIRIPQWAVRGEYYFKDSHLELVWIPYTTFDNIGKAGAEFFPFQVPPPAGFRQEFANEQIPARSVSNSNYGARFSTLQNGWDLSAFYYRSMDAAPTFYREINLAPTPTIRYQARHDPIQQLGGTLSKDLGATVLKAEVIFTSGRSFNVTRFDQDNGLVRKNTLDYVLGFDFNFTNDTRLNVQAFQRAYLSHDPDMLQERFETGTSVLVSTKLSSKLEPELLWIQSLNRWENLIRPRLVWRPEQNWRVAFGVDIFNGPVEGFLGRYNARDRIYVETRYDF